MRGRVSVAELMDRGLAGQPACVSGVGLREPSLTVLCRAHVSGQVLTLLALVSVDLGHDMSMMTAVLPSLGGRAAQISSLLRSFAVFAGSRSSGPETVAPSSYVSALMLFSMT